MRFRLLCLFLISLVLPLPGQTGWFWQNPLPQGNALMAIAPAGAARFFAAGRMGSIARSDDSGMTWRSLQSGVTSNLYALLFFNADSGLAAGAGGTILRTWDGGATWSRLPLPDTTTIYSLFGSDDDILLAGGYNGRIYKSANGGDSWVSRDSKTTLSLFTIADNGIDYIYAAGAPGPMVRSKDRGETWSNYTWTATPVIVRALAFPGNNIGLIAAEGGRIYRSQTKGDSWQLLLRLAGNPELRALCFGDALHGYICGDGGTLASTSDAGATWPLMDGGTTQNLFAVAANSSGAGVAAGANGMLLSSASWGGLWQNRLRTFSPAKLKGLHLVDMDIAYAVGDSSGKGMIFRTDDSGGNWHAQYRRAGVLLEDLFFINSDSGFVVGTGGTLLRTVDGGGSWSLVTGLPLSSSFYGIHFASRTAGTIVGGSGAILRTVDGGTTWGAQSTSGQTLQAVHFVHPDTGLAVGFGTIRRTVNGGTAWTPVTPPAGTGNQFFNSVAFGNSFVALIVGSSGTILRSSDRGVTWSKITVPGLSTTTSLEQVTFASTETAFITGAGGVILRSDDSGLSWRPLASPTSSSLNAVRFLNIDNGCAVGDNGTVLRTRDGGLPVELVSFSARWHAASSGVLLAWATASETNNYGFRIERRMDAEWVQVGFVAGSGTTVREQKYSFIDRPESAGSRLFYRLWQIDLDGSSQLLQTIGVAAGAVAEEFALWQNHPNPFNARTSFAFSLPRESLVELIVYDLLGRQVAQPLNRVLPAGQHRIPWEAGTLPSGLYYYRLTCESGQAGGKMLLLR